MLDEKICELRDKLNKSIEQGEDYDKTYELSTQLDRLIVEYYQELKKNKKKVAWMPL